MTTKLDPSRSGRSRLRNPREAASSRPASPAGESSAASSASPNAAPPPATEKKAALALRFSLNLAAIYAGTITPASDFFTPLVHANPMTDTIVGIVSSRRAQEFYSLAQRLKSESGSLRLPRVPEEVEAWQKERTEISELSELALRLFWNEVKAQFPDEEKPGFVLGITAGWRVTLSRHEDLEHPVGFLEMLLRRQGAGGEGA